MSKILTTLCICCFSLLLAAQTRFEPGYFISNDGSKTACLIKNID
jgi:hypothetical protein